jgi:hypothetical protein
VKRAQKIVITVVTLPAWSWSEIGFSIRDGVQHFSITTGVVVIKKNRLAKYVVQKQQRVI